jgi:TRAP-type uncharacterized transport system substrate-binding protein
MKKLSCLLLLLLALPAFAQQPAVQAPVTLLVADGSSSGTYAQIMKELMVGVMDQNGVALVTFKEVESHGAVENLDLLVNNKVAVAFMHSDVINFRSNAEDLSRFKTLLALFHEDVHFVALTTSKTIVGGWHGIGGKPLVLNSIQDLEGCKVGAAGGGFITAKTIQLNGQLRYEVTQFNSGSEVLAALDKGEIDAAVFVGAAPLPNLEKLDNNYKILPIPSLIQDRLKGVYKSSTVTYTKMSPNAVSTVSAQCLMVSKTYKSEKMVSQLAAFRKAFYAHLDDIKETPGNHKKWADVSETERGRWPWLSLPGDAAVKADDSAQ